MFVLLTLARTSDVEYRVGGEASRKARVRLARVDEDSGSGFGSLFCGCSL